MIDLLDIKNSRDIYPLVEGINILKKYASGIYFKDCEIRVELHRGHNPTISEVEWLANCRWRTDHLAKNPWVFELPDFTE